MALAAETVGAADRALTEAIAYTSQRIVFDRPVATYQTVRHRLVEMFQQVEMARAGVQFAAWASDTDAPERGQAAAMAASYAAEAGVRVTGDDIQLHGGVGFTWANDAHFLFKRVKQNEVLFGGVSQERHRLASLFMGLWFLATAAGELLAGQLAALTDRVARGEIFRLLGGQADFYLIFVVSGTVAALGLALLRPKLRRLMHGRDT